jgi:hypothetical protein
MLRTTENCYFQYKWLYNVFIGFILYYKVGYKKMYTINHFPPDCGNQCHIDFLNRLSRVPPSSDLVNPSKPNFFLLLLFSTFNLFFFPMILMMQIFFVSFTLFSMYIQLSKMSYHSIFFSLLREWALPVLSITIEKLY